MPLSPFPIIRARDWTDPTHGMPAEYPGDGRPHRDPLTGAIRAGDPAGRAMVYGPVTPVSAGQFAAWDGAGGVQAAPYAPVNRAGDTMTGDLTVSGNGGSLIFAPAAFGAGVLTIVPGASAANFDNTGSLGYFFKASNGQFKITSRGENNKVIAAFHATANSPTLKLIPHSVQSTDIFQIRNAGDTATLAAITQTGAITAPSIANPTAALTLGNATHGVTVAGSMRAASGTAPSTAYGFQAAANAGMYLDSNAHLSFATGGTDRVKMSSIGLVVRVPIYHDLSTTNIRGRADIANAVQVSYASGTGTPATTLLNVVGPTTGSQLRSGFDANNRWSASTNSTGGTTFTAAGTSPSFTFSGGAATFNGNILSGADNTYDMGAPSANRPRTLHLANGQSFRGAPDNPTTSDIAAGNSVVWNNTDLNETRLWANVGGTLKSVLLS